MNSKSYLKELICSQCGKSYSSDTVQTFCHECVAPLQAVYDLVRARAELDRDEFRKRNKGMWRWSELLPVQNETNCLTLGEGDTPLLKQTRLGETLDLPRLWVKEEGVNPTGSFKARGLAAAVSKAGELGIHNLVIPTAGNAGGALAAYAARGGLKAHIIMPSDTPLANSQECRITGATVEFVDGLISDAAKIAGRMAQEEGFFDVSTFKEPYRLEGKKVLGYELAEAFNWELPDVIIYPTGGGTGLIGMWKAFAELEQLGWLKNTKRPRMVSVQAAGCAPVVKAFENGDFYCEFWEDAETIASGLRVPKSFADRLIMQCLYDSQGMAMAVSDAEIQQAQQEWGNLEGLFTCPEGAATLAALKKLLSPGSFGDHPWIQAEEHVVLFNTATGLKYI